MDTQKITKIMKALSHPNRFDLFMEIFKKQQFSYEKEECFIYDIMQKFNIGAPTISHHLKELANADLISTKRKGKLLVAWINKETIKELNGVLKLE